jgi:hypothetical protein
MIPKKTSKNGRPSACLCKSNAPLVDQEVATVATVALFKPESAQVKFKTAQPANSDVLRGCTAGQNMPVALFEPLFLSPVRLNS